MDYNIRDILKRKEYNDIFSRYNLEERMMFLSLSSRVRITTAVSEL